MPILFDFVLMILLGWFFLSQLIIPTIKNQPLFPALRKKNPVNPLVTQIKTVEEELEAADLATKLDEKKEQLTKKRSKKQSQ